METCEPIIKVLKEYIKLPEYESERKMLAESFNQRWNFPHCIGAIDGKHVSITKPPGTGSQFFNYKKHFSIILMAIVNSNCEFIMVEVGANGRCSDAGMFGETKFFSKLKQNRLNIPAPELISNFSIEMPYVFVADDAFPLMTNIMKPFSHKSMDKKEMIYNYRLSRARGNVEMTFGQLTSKFRVLLKPINLAPEKATTITLACCYLHNYLRRKKDTVYASNESTENLNTDPLTPLRSTTAKNVCNNIKSIRQNFCEYFNTIGEVSWQNNVYEKLINPNTQK
ncbi:uncharacterized protein LOC129940971 [Eupeodes corollae]|uniref:uncharacterized protein LOC129940971 n=1 Tax=Eupeodes corollae TaxID=290404 RepID=UPI002490073E|nr:uncharacterized protein LOC129940971 [Eupeodes corollae]